MQCNLCLIEELNQVGCLWALERDLGMYRLDAL